MIPQQHAFRWRAIGARLQFWVCALLLAGWTLLASAAPAPIAVLTIEGPIGPANADYVVRGLARAADTGKQLVILKMDTPGGLDTAMRSIIKAILNSPIPIASYVAPGGARAASAGTYILYASHIAAMAPGTNLGAATPVQVGDNTPSEPGRINPLSRQNPDAQDQKPDAAEPVPASTMTRKQVNDAAAYIRGLAQLRGRNVDWAERAVREAVSLPAQDALRMQVVEYIAADIPDLLAMLDGKQVVVQGESRLLQTQGAVVMDIRPDWRTKLLGAITNPSFALLLMSIGMYGIIFEFMNPGFGAPGVIGMICLLLAFYGLQLLPVNYVGVALILLGMGFMLAEAFLPSFGIVGVGGLVAFVTGGLIMMDTDLPGLGIPLVLIVSVAVVSALLLISMAGVVLKTRQRPVTGDPGDLVGSVAEVMAFSGTEGWVQLRGETWRAFSPAALQAGQRVKVVARKGLILEVVAIADKTQGE